MIYLYFKFILLFNQFDKVLKKLNLTSITAASSVQTAIEGYADGHGIFTYILSDALDGDAYAEAWGQYEASGGKW